MSSLKAMKNAVEWGDSFVAEPTICTDKIFDDLRKAIKEAEHPQGYVHKAVDLTGSIISDNPNEYGANTIPIYTTPPAREWVGLSPSDIDLIKIMSEQDDCDDIIALVESILEEKNDE